MQKTALVTGASRGIGKAVALALSERGFAVAVNYRKDRQGAEDTALRIRESGGTAELFPCDIADSAQVNAMFKAVQNTLGHISVLVNNAGIAQQKLFTDITDEDFHQMLSTNLSGAFYCTRAALPAMISEKYGRIINIASMWGEIGGSCEVHYSAAKAGVIGMTKALAKEVAPSGITVNCVSPGVIGTDMLSGFTEADLEALREETPAGRLGTSADIANAVAFFASENADFITGQILGVNGGMVI